jgi:GNAT superfamily N-acetyltransferase
MDADLAAQGLLNAWRRVGSEVPGFSSKAAAGAVATITGVPLALLNGVWVESVGIDADTVVGLLDHVARTGQPYCLQCRPGAADALSAVASARGMHQAREIPLMAATSMDGAGHTELAGGLVVREVDPSEAELHAQVAADGFEAPIDLFRQLITTDLLAVAGVRCYVGESEGQPVSTGLGVMVGAAVVIFNIATPPAHRRRGFGAAVTRRVAADGLAAGADWALLQSSDAGYGLYEHLGFRTVERWRTWVSPES